MPSLIERTRAMLGVVIFGALELVLPAEEPVSKSETMDWVGSFFGITGMILLNIAFK